MQYVDHNLLQTDFKNADDHKFLKSAAQRFGLWFSRPGNGVSHPVHMERFGKPGKTMVGSDSHTCAAGSLGMLAIGTGGLDVAAAIAGQPYFVKMPKIMGVKLTGKLPDWVSAKDVVLEMLRRHDVKGGVGKIIEYYGDGLQQLSAMDRHVIAKSYARIAWQNLVNFGIIPLEFIDESDYELIDQGDDIELKDVINSVKSNQPIEVVIHKSNNENKTIKTKHILSNRQIEILIKGGIINDFRERL